MYCSPVTVLETNSSYTSFKSLKEIRVSLLSGKHTGVVVLSVLSKDRSSFSGFISSLKHHPALSEVQVVIVDTLQAEFPELNSNEIKFCNIKQISKLIDCPLVKSESKDNLEVDNLPPSLFKEEEPYPDNIELLKHLSAKTIAEMIEEKVISKSRKEVLEIFLLKIKENQLNSPF